MAGICRLVRLKPELDGGRYEPSQTARPARQIDNQDVGRKKPVVNEVEGQVVPGGTRNALRGVPDLRPLKSPSGEGLRLGLQAFAGLPLSV